jgi:hypothetical protein
VRGDTTVENTSIAVHEVWDRDAAAQASSGAYHSAMTAGSASSFTFTGTNVRVVGLRSAAGGYADVYLDGVKKASKVSFYNATTQWQRTICSLSGLSAARHTVQLRVLGTHPSASKGNWVYVDAFAVGTTLYQESGPQVKETFRRVTTSNASGGSYDAVWHATAGDTGGRPYYAMTFVGTGVTVYGVKSVGSGSAAVYIDGVLRKTVNLHDSGTLYRYPVFGISKLAGGTHTIRVEAVGTATGTNSAVGVDYFKIS